MLNQIIDSSLKHRTAVLFIVLCLIVVGIIALLRIDIDAFPDTTPVQVQVNTTAPALLAE